MKKKTLAAILGASVLGISAALAGCGSAPASAPAHDPVLDPTDDNNRVFYQIFVGSFSDSDGDGIGDIRGIINRMDYLNDGDVDSGKSLGVQGIWLSPIFKSPSYHKYDSSDYYTVDSKFGTRADLEELIDLCHERNVKIILDIAINHTSTSHPWFTSFAAAHRTGDTGSKYYDYYTYVAADEQEEEKEYYRIASTDEYYEGNFSSEMPELNYDNQDVRDEMLQVARYYLGLGVDGFRFDAIKYIYYKDNARSADFWQWYMDKLRVIKPDIYCVGECWDPDGTIMQYYGALDCFAFSAADMYGTISSATRAGYVRTFTEHAEKFINDITEKRDGALFMPFLSNHDQNRVGGYLTSESGYAQVAANLMLLCPGSPFIYYGEEIEMKGVRGSENTDANRRLAMLWGDGDTIADPEGATYDRADQINGTVKSQLSKSNSLLNHYRKLISLRVKYPEIARGKCTAFNINNPVGGFEIEYKGVKVCVLHNTGAESATVDLAQAGLDYNTLGDYIGVGRASLSGATLKVDKQTSVILTKTVAA